MQTKTVLEKLRQDGVPVSESAQVIPLGGGVSSEIWLVRTDQNSFVVKSALEKLKVTQDWRADPVRNLSEQRYINYVASFLPQAVPRIQFSGKGYFAMEYFDERFINWKSALLKGDCQESHARQAMSLLARIHLQSRHQPEMAAQFDTTQNFHQLRTDPYLLATARHHPEIAPLFEEEAARLESTRECLVHGDFSPKNMLTAPDRFVILDCEVAWFGDPAFDVAFLLNHLCLKALYHAPRDLGLERLFEAAVAEYFQRELPPRMDLRQINQRSARLLLMLLVARVDGKSPAEYLDRPRQQFVREFVSRWLPRLYPPSRKTSADLAQVGSLWFSAVKTRFPPT